jgi:hypothetical protein
VGQRHVARVAPARHRHPAAMRGVLLRASTWCQRSPRWASTLRQRPSATAPPGCRCRPGRRCSSAPGCSCSGTGRAQGVRRQRLGGAEAERRVHRHFRLALHPHSDQAVTLAGTRIEPRGVAPGCVYSGVDGSLSAPPSASA